MKNLPVWQGYVILAIFSWNYFRFVKFMGKIVQKLSLVGSGSTLYICASNLRKKIHKNHGISTRIMEFPLVRINCESLAPGGNMNEIMFPERRFTRKKGALFTDLPIITFTINSKSYQRPHGALWWLLRQIVVVLVSWCYNRFQEIRKLMPPIAPSKAAPLHSRAANQSPKWW